MEEKILNAQDAAEEKFAEETAEVKYKKVSYWTVVWSQFRKNKLALIGLGCIVFLFLLAIFAPLISSDAPYRMTVGGVTTYPLLQELFNRNYFENGVDIFFNIIMVAFLGYALLFYLMVRVWKQSALKAAGLILALQVAAFISVSVWGNSKMYRNYKSLVAQYESEGKQVRAVFPPVRYSFRETDSVMQNPQAPSRRHLLGTDSEGRDVFARMLYGTRISMTIGVVAVSIYVMIGIFLGAMAGYFGGAVDLWISRLIEVVICFPTFFLILTISAFLEKRTIFHIMLLIGVISWTSVARLVRGEFLRLRGLDYVQAAIALGISKTKIIFSHVLPNAMGPVLVSATFGIAAAILTESSLSFLGLGDPTAPSWGGILNVGRQQGKLWLILSPGFAIFFVVSVFNLVGEALRDAMDPKLRQ